MAITQASHKSKEDGSAADIQAAQVRGRMIGVLGVKGGVGASTVAVNLAACLGSSGEAVLFDANLQQPDAACLLNRSPRFSLLDLLSKPLDAEMLAVVCETIGLDQGVVKLLSPPMDAASALQIEGADITRLLGALKEISRAPVVVDLPRNIDSQLVANLDLMHKLVVVLEATVPALAAARRWFDVFQDLGIGPEKVVVVLNRTGGKMKEIESQLDSKLRGYAMLRLPSAYEAVEKSCIDGVPLVVQAPKSNYARSMQELSGHVLR